MERLRRLGSRDRRIRGVLLCREGGWEGIIKEWCAMSYVYIAGSGHRPLSDHKWSVHAFQSTGRVIPVPAHLHQLSRVIQVIFHDVLPSGEYVVETGMHRPQGLTRKSLTP
jgi:hypothetical protein